MKANYKFGSTLQKLYALTMIVLTSAVITAASNDLKKFDDWSIVGPNGGDVRVVTIDPRNKNRLYVSTLDGQIHTSGDGGNTWSLLVNLNRPQLVLDQLFVDSQDSNIIYASGHRHKEAGGFFKSADAGKTWKEAKELKSESIHSMTQSLNNPNILMVGTINGVWESKDKGDSWKKIKSDTMPINIDSMAIDPRDDSTIFAGTWWRAYKSTDSGKTWRLIKDGMIDDSDVFAITVNPRNPDHIVASACSGIYESFNNGEKWAKIQGIPSQSRRTRDIVQHPSLEGVIYAGTTEGFWLSTNGGKTWSMTTQRNLEINSIAVHPSEPNKVFIATNNYGVMVSNDGGRNFSQTNDRFTSRFTYSITTDLEEPGRLYATTHNTATGGGFVFISSDAGRTWEQSKNLDVTRVSPFAIIQDRVDPKILYMGSNTGIFKSVDRGVNWFQVTAPKPVRAARSTKRSSRTKAAPQPVKVSTVPALTEKVKVLAYTQDGKNGFLAGTDSGLYRSYDISQGWEKLDLGVGIANNIFVITTNPQLPGTIWAGTSISGVLVSEDNGTTWRKVKGIPEGIPISSIRVDPQDPEKVYVGTLQTLYLTRDGGNSWVRRGGNLPLGNYTSILINPRNTNEVYVSSALQADGGIYFSEDAGQNWKRIDSKNLGLPSHRVWTLAFDPVDSNRIFAGTHSSGVYMIERKSSSVAAEVREVTGGDTRLGN
ncbi:MAG: hypothetical protein KIS76_01455 [Pyrinomonadaceae bacterium]|nr:hypothetical protein [Pyrinomonadaceae bacterium]